MIRITWDIKFVSKWESGVMSSHISYCQSKYLTSYRVDFMDTLYS